MEQQNKLLEIDANTSVEVARPSEVVFRLDDGDLVAKVGESVVPVDKSEELLWEFYDIPRPFARNKLKPSPRVLRDVFTAVKKSKTDKPFQWAIHNDNGIATISSIGQADKPYVPYGDFMRVLREIGMTVKGARILPEKGGAYITATHHEKNKVEAKEGDVLESGIMAKVSPVFQFNPIEQPYVSRLICLNGATDRQFKHRFKIMGSTPEEVLQEFHDIAEAAFDEAAHMGQKMVRLQDDVVSNPVQTLERIGAAHNIPDYLMQNMRKDAAALPARHYNMYEVMNIVTYHATHKVANPDLAFHIMGHAGHLAEEQHCEECGTLLN